MELLNPKNNKALYCDIAIYACLFAFLTGGIIIDSKHPNFFIEWSELSFPVGVATVVLLWNGYLQTSALTTLKSFQYLSKFWYWWKKSLDQSPKTHLWSLVGVWSVLFFLVGWRRHASFSTHDYDIGIFTNAIWNLSHGNGYYSSIREMSSLFMDHQSPIFYLFAPIYAIFPHVEVLLAIQAFGICAGAVPVYFLAKQYQADHPWIPYFLPIAFLLHKPFLHAANFDFHPEVLMLSIFLTAIYLLQTTHRFQRFLGFLFFLAGLACKESAGPLAVGLGLSWILGVGPQSSQKFLKKFGWVALSLGFLVFGFDIIIVPKIFGRTYEYAREYAYLKHFDTFFSGILSHFTPKRLQFLGFTFGPFLMIPILFWRGSFALWIAVAMLFFGETERRTYLNYHYGIEPGVGIFAFLTPALLCFEPKWNHWIQKKNLQKFAVSLFSCFIFSTFIFSGRSAIAFIKRYVLTPQDEWIGREVVPRIHPSASLVTGGHIIPHLANRRFIAAHGQKLINEMPFDCYFTDDRAGFARSVHQKGEFWVHSENDQDVLVEKILQCKNFYLFQRVGAPESCLTELPPCTLNDR